MKTITLFLCSCMIIAVSQAQVRDSLMLYCTFDDVNSITYPVAGPAGTFNADPVTNFTTGQVGNAYMARYDEDKLVFFPKEVVPNNRGCIEIWAKLFDVPDYIPTGDNPSFFDAVPVNPVWADPEYMIMFNGNDGWGGAGISSRAAGGSASTGCWWYSYSFESQIGDVNAWHHYALSWDINGVPGSKYNIQMYLDGIPVGESGPNCDGFDRTPINFYTAGDLYIINFQNMEQGSAAVDELKIWNYAKTQFIDHAFIYTVLNDKQICINDSAAFEVKAVGIPPINYQWQKDGADISGATDGVLTFAQVQPLDAGDYRCIASNSYGIDTSNTATLWVEFAKPTEIQGFTNVAEYQVATYSVEIQQGHTYEFIVEGGNRIDGTENSVMVHWGTAGIGNVKLIETSDIGCDADTNTLNVVIGSLGVEESAVGGQRSAVNIYPNPSNGKTTFYYTLTEASQVTVQIYNAFGQLIGTPMNAFQHGGNHQVQWNAEGLPAGVYFYKFFANDSSENGKIILNKF